MWHKSKEELYGLCKKDLAVYTSLRGHDVEELFVLKKPHAYPLYRLGYRDHLDRVLHFIQGIPTIRTLGRNGKFQYMDVDECMNQAFEFVDTNKRG